MFVHLEKSNPERPDGRTPKMNSVKTSCHSRAQRLKWLMQPCFTLCTTASPGTCPRPLTRHGWTSCPSTVANLLMVSMVFSSVRGFSCTMSPCCDQSYRIPSFRSATIMFNNLLSGCLVLSRLWSLSVLSSVLLHSPCPKVAVLSCPFCCFLVFCFYSDFFMFRPIKPSFICSCPILHSAGPTWLQADPSAFKVLPTHISSWRLAFKMKATVHPLTVFLLRRSWDCVSKLLNLFHVHLPFTSFEEKNMQADFIVVLQTLPTQFLWRM